MTRIIQGNVLHLPLPDESVDLIVTSPPYFSLRSYQDDGTHYAGQIGSEPTPKDYLDALIAATAEMVRVLKPFGSIWLNLGDKYSGSGGHNNSNLSPTAGHSRGPAGSYRRDAPTRYVDGGTVAAKSLMLLPHRYAIRCVDELGLICRQDQVWSKPNGLPESVTDRTRRSHEYFFHFVKSPRYYSAVDEIRIPNSRAAEVSYSGGANKWVHAVPGDRNDWGNPINQNPLGALPGSVWTISSEPLFIPEWARTKYDLPDHFAAFPQEWPRRLILGWSPNGICVACGEGRRPVVAKSAEGEPRFDHGMGKRHTAEGLTSFSGQRPNAEGDSRVTPWATDVSAMITGYACACPEPTAETTPARVVDVFGGTGTVALVADALGREGISIDLSHDYCRLAEWRCKESGHGRKALQKTWGERQQALGVGG